MMGSQFVLKRQVKRPNFTSRDRIRLIILSRLTRFWDQALHLIQPQTVFRWHRDLFRLYWIHISKTKHRKPPIPQETIDLIKEMAQNNRLWSTKQGRSCIRPLPPLPPNTSLLILRTTTTRIEPIKESGKRFPHSSIDRSRFSPTKSRKTLLLSHFLIVCITATLMHRADF